MELKDSFSVAVVKCTEFVRLALSKFKQSPRSAIYAVPLV